MKLKRLSRKQMITLTWWCRKSRNRNKDAIICDGAVRSGKTLCMGLSFVLWAFYRFRGMNFAICGKTIRNVKRNLVFEIVPILKGLGFTCELRHSENRLDIRIGSKVNRFYLFGGKDESSASLIQGMTLAGVLFDEAALMPRSFVEQALARCSVEGAKFWFNCNPEHPGHWFFTEWISKINERNALYLHFTMRDNPSLTKETIERYKNMFSGTFYKRFVEGKWVKAEGLIYPFMNENMFFDVPQAPFEDFAVSVDYGTVNPTSMGLWGKKDKRWYRIDEYYYSSRENGVQRTDEEHYAALEKLVKDKKISYIVVDPSAASFITLIKKKGKYKVTAAENNVVNGIRLTSSALKEGKIRICRNCYSTIKEFGLYSWQNDNARDLPLKENDHAMDDIRYFTASINEKSPYENRIFAVVRR